MNFREVEGWFDDNDHRVYSELYELLPDGAIVAELGVAKGRSICSVADIIKRKNITVYAIDTFEGTENEGKAHIDAKTSDWKQIFTNNVIKFGLSAQDAMTGMFAYGGSVQILQGRTDEMYKFFDEGTLDLIMIDAAHDAISVESDIRLWKPKLKETGILVGHDETWASVRDGYTKAGLQPVADGNMWFVKPAKTQEKPLWSVCLIARNEAKVLPKAIESLKEFQKRGGEVCLVDTGSKDDTVKIAKEAGWKVEEVGERFKHFIDADLAKKINDKFIVGDEAIILKEGDSLFDFAAARNHVASIASNDMISMMDCDEAFTKLDIDEINKLIQQGFNQFEYHFVFSHLPDGKPAIEFKQSKMYDRRVMRWEGIIHECLQGPGRRKYLPKEIFLLEHFQNLETNRTGYLRGLALDCFRNPENDRNSHYFAREMLWTGRPKSAIKEFEKHISMNRWVTEKSKSYIFMGEAYVMLGNEEKARECWLKAFDIEPGRREPLIKLAEFWQKKNDPARANIYARASLEISQGDFYANDASHYRDVPHALLYWALWHLGKREEGRIHLDKAWEFDRKNPKYAFEARHFYDLPKVSVLLPTKGRPEGTERVLKSIANLHYPGSLIEVLHEDGDDTVPNKIARLFAKSSGEWIVYAANDMVFDPSSLMIALKYAWDTNKRLVAFNSGVVLPDKGNICEHFLIKRDLVDKLSNGDIFDRDFNHVGCDNWLWAQVDKMGEAIRCDDALIDHHHFSTGKSSYDATYKEAWSKADQDRAILREKLAKLYDR